MTHSCPVSKLRRPTLFYLFVIISYSKVISLFCVKALPGSRV